MNTQLILVSLLFALIGYYIAMRQPREHKREKQQFLPGVPTPTQFLPPSQKYIFI